jgi:hypothetical protein
MSSNMLVLTLGMVSAGPLTEAFGPREMWAGAAILSAIASVVGLVLARGVRAPAEIGGPEVEAAGRTAH